MLNLDTDRVVTKRLSYIYMFKQHKTQDLENLSFSKLYNNSEII